MYLDILKILAQKRAVKVTELMYETNVNCSVLKERLEFLMEKEFVVEKTLKTGSIVFDVTEKGLRVLKQFRELQTMFSVNETDNVKVQTLLY